MMRFELSAKNDMIELILIRGSDGGIEYFFLSLKRKADALGDLCEYYKELSYKTTKYYNL